MAQVIHTTDVQLFNILKSKFTEEEASSTVSLIKETVKAEVKSKVKAVSSHLATKEDVRTWFLISIPLIVGTIMGFVYFLYSQSNEQMKMMQEQSNEQMKMIREEHREQMKMIQEQMKMMQEQFNEQITRLDQKIDRQSEKSDRQHEQVILLLLNGKDKK